MSATGKIEWGYIIKSALRRFAFAIGIAGSFASLVAILLLFDKIGPDGQTAVIFIGIIALLLLAENLYLRYVYLREERYARAFENLNRGFAELHQIDKIQQGVLIKKAQVFERLCTNLAETFKTITKSECAVNIKILYRLTGEDGQPNKEIFVKTVYRDTLSRDRYGGDGKERGDMNIEDNNVFKNGVKAHKETKATQDIFFFSNNLVDESIDEYSNSKLREEGYYRAIYAINNPITKKIQKERLWTLKYRSGIVTPILPLQREYEEYPKLHGFLCVDSIDKNVFDKRYDLKIMQGVSDALYYKFMIHPPYLTDSMTITQN